MIKQSSELKINRMESLFYTYAIKHMNRTLLKTINKISKTNYENFTYDELISSIKLSLLKDYKFPILSSNTNRILSQKKQPNIEILFKTLSLYPVEGDDYQYWNQHVELFSQLELQEKEKKFGEICEFLELFGIQEIPNVLSKSDLNNIEVHRLILILHMDHIASKSLNAKSICFNQILKIQYKNKKIHEPSKTLSDILRFLAGCNVSEKILTEIPSVTATEDWFYESTENPLTDEEERYMMQLIKKLRENKKICLLEDMFFVIGLPIHPELKTLEDVDKINTKFLDSNSDLEYVRFSNLRAIWLIYIYQIFLVSNFSKEQKENLLESSLFLDLWNKFLTIYPSEGQKFWPSELEE